MEVRFLRGEGGNIESSSDPALDFFETEAISANLHKLETLNFMKGALCREDARLPLRYC